MRSRTTLVSSRADSVNSPADSVKHLLARALPSLTRVTDQAVRQHFWNEWMSLHLPPDIRAKISGIVQRDRQLVIFAESAPWSARLRYAVLEREAAIRAADPELTDIAVRVLPRG